MKKTTDDARRDFLKKLLGGTAAALALPSVEAFGSTSPELPAALSAAPDELYWELVKKQFAVPSKLMMVNAANLCPAPYFILEGMQASLKDLSEDVSFQFRDRYDDIRKRSLEKLAAYFGVTKEEVGITRNTSESNNIVVNGYDFKTGDEIILWDQNHDSNGLAWENRARRYGFIIKKVSVPASPRTQDELIAPFAKAITSKTRLIAFSHVSNTSGIALPAKELCKLAREKKILSHVDGAQSFGFMDLNLHELGCDTYSGSTHKWLMGPLENGVLYVSKEAMPQLWPNIVSAGWKQASTTVDEKYCVLGQRNETTPAALPETLEFHLTTVGKKNVEDRVRQLNAYLKEKLQQRFPQATFISPLSRELSGGIVVVNLPGKQPQELYQRLYSEHGIAGAGMAGLRLSPNIYNTMGDIDRIVSALGSIAG